MDINTLVKLAPNKNVPQLSPGDTVKVTVKVIEGEKQRSQLFQGIIIRVRKGTNNAAFTVRRVTHGIGVERTFMTHSPLLEKVEVTRHGDVRRARLFYLRGLSTREARAKDKGKALTAEELATMSEAQVEPLVAESAVAVAVSAETPKAESSAEPADKAK